MKFEEIAITPETAERWLATSPKNRKIRKGHVERMAQAMSGDRWRLTHQGIAFDKDGELIDGHHRLHAIIRCGLTVPMIVTRGVDRDDFAVLDGGAKRGAHDALAYMGEEHAKEIAAACRWIHRYDNGYMQGSTLDKYPDNDIIVETFDRNQGIRQSVEIASSYPYLMSRNTLAFVHYFAAMHDQDMAFEFIEGVCTGEMMKSDDPRFMLRSRALSDRISKMKLDHFTTAALTVKAWSLFAQGETRRFLTWRSRGPMAEPFPEIFGSPPRLVGAAR